MASGIRFTKPEREFIRRAIGICTTEREEELRQSILLKLDRSEQPKPKANGISVGDAITAFREVLGTRLVVPPNPSAGWYAQLGKRLADSGISLAQATVIAKQADVSWSRGSIKAESLIRQCDVLLAESQQELPNFVDYFGRESTTMEDL